MKSNPDLAKQTELENPYQSKINSSPSTTQSIVNQNNNESNNYGINDINQPYLFNGPLNYSNFSIDNKLFSFLK